MLGQTSHPNEQCSLPLQVETDQAALSQDVGSRQSIRFLWTALGFAVLMLMACTEKLGFGGQRLASHGPAKPSRDAAAFAFSPTLPALGHGGIRSAIKNRHPTALAGVRVSQPGWAAPNSELDAPLGSTVAPDSRLFGARMSTDAWFRPPRRLLQDYSGVMSVDIEQQLNFWNEVCPKGAMLKSPGKMRDIWSSLTYEGGDAEFDVTDAMLQEDGLDGKLDKAQRIYIGSSLPLDAYANFETDSLHPIVMEFYRPMGGWDARYLFDCIEKVDSLQRPNSVWFGGVDCHHTFFEGLTFDEQKGAYLAMWGS